MAKDTEFDKRVRELIPLILEASRRRGVKYQWGTAYRVAAGTVRTQMKRDQHAHAQDN